MEKCNNCHETYSADPAPGIKHDLIIVSPISSHQCMNGSMMVCHGSILMTTRLKYTSLLVLAVVPCFAMACVNNDDQEVEHKNGGGGGGGTTTTTTSTTTKTTSWVLQ